MPRPTRHLLLAAACAGTLALTGCADAGTEPGPRAAGGDVASCVAGLTIDGTFYLRVSAEPVTAAEPVPDAQLPPCDDTGTSDGEATPVEAFAIAGVEARYAVVSHLDTGPAVYVAQPYAPGFRGARPLPAEVAETLGLD